MTSTKAPSRSIARYRYRHRPRTRIYVSSMYQLGPTLPLRRRRRCSASVGGLPIAHRFIAEGEPAGQEHLGQISQVQFVTQPPEHHECDDIAQILHTVEHTGAALVELFAAVRAPEPTIALRSPLRPLADRRRSTCRALHCFQSPQRAERARYIRWR